MQTKLTVIIICTGLLFFASVSATELNPNPVCLNNFLEPKVCLVSEYRYKLSTNKTDTVIAFIKLVSKLVVKAFIKSSVNSFIKMTLKELLNSVTNKFIKSIIQLLIKLLANVASNLLTYAFTQYLVKLIIRKIQKTAKRIVRITVFKTFIKRCVKYVAGKFSKPFILHINQKARFIIRNNVVIHKSKAFLKKLKKLHTFKGLNKFKKIKLVKKYRKFIQKTLFENKPVFQINKVNESQDKKIDDKDQLFDYQADQNVINQGINYSVIENNDEYTEIGVEVCEQLSESIDNRESNEWKSVDELNDFTDDKFENKETSYANIGLRWMVLLASVVGYHELRSFNNITRDSTRLVYK